MIKENIPEIKKSNVEKWWEKGYKGQNITVLVLDDEGDKHSWFDAKITTAGKYHEGIGHSTNVAKVIRTFAPECNIIMHNCFGKHSDSDEKTLKFIKAHNIDLINISYAAAPRNMFKEINKLGVPMICSSGNGGNYNRISFPADYPFTIAVGAFDEKRWNLARGSNQGENLDCVGFTYIYVWNEEKNKYYAFNGTSCAVPYVAGLLANYLSYLKENNIQITTEELRSFIHENCIDLYNKGHDWKSGYGLFILPEIIKKKEATKLEDIQEHWAKESIKNMIETGIMLGYPDGTFKPDNNITRAEMAVIAERILKKARE